MFFNHGVILKRLIDSHLIDWSKQNGRKPVLLRGARQVGKTYAVRQLGKRFESFVELNLELEPEARNLFVADLRPDRIVRDISLLTGKKIIPGKTLLFLDEVQIEPKAIQALRYFYELMPDLHVIAAGSLLDFAIESIGMPVGRVQSLYMYPMSFLEFMEALGEEILLETLLEHDEDQLMNEIAHNKLLKLVGNYMAIGGMPEVVYVWVSTQDPHKCFEIQQTLIDSYRQDFGKYAKKFQIKYLDLLFDRLPMQLGKKFKYSAIEGEYRKRELAPCLDLLSTAGIVHKIINTSAQGLPLGAQANPGMFKIAFLDIALAQSMLGFNLADWFLNLKDQFVNKGEIVEAFVGQELLAYSNPIQRQQLYYWQRMERNSQAEIDYVTTIEGKVVPIEVKSGAGTTLKSLHLFMDTHLNSEFGIKFSMQNYSKFEKINSYPLYAIALAVKSRLINNFDT